MLENKFSLEPRHAQPFDHSLTKFQIANLFLYNKFLKSGYKLFSYKLFILTLAFARFGFKAPPSINFQGKNHDYANHDYY